MSPRRPISPRIRPGLTPAAPPRRARASVMIIVMWVCLGLVALTLYFGNSMIGELRAADYRVAEVTARQAAAGGARYAAYVLSQFGTAGTVPRIEDYQAEDLPVGDGSFWFIGRDTNQVPGTEPYFALVDEASKINLNTAPRAMLEALPLITPELVDAILSWRSRNAADSGDSNYSRLDPPRTNKAGPFETADELRLVYGATLELILGEDTNRNGILDENENDAERSAPRDNGDGLLQAGLLEYVTVWSREPNTRSTGGRRINITTTQGRAQIDNVLRQRFGPQRAQQIAAAVGPGQIRSVAEYMVAGRFTAEEWNQIRTEVTHRDGATVQGLVNVNTASETVLACIPGIGPENASALVAYRLQNPDVLTSFFWLTQLLTRGDLARAGPYLTDRSYQFSADVAAVGRAGRGYCRQKTIYDLSAGTPRAVYRQDLSAAGWALGSAVRQSLRETRADRT